MKLSSENFATAVAQFVFAVGCALAAFVWNLGVPPLHEGVFWILIYCSALFALGIFTSLMGICVPSDWINSAYAWARQYFSRWYTDEVPFHREIVVRAKLIRIWFWKQYQHFRSWIRYRVGR